MNEQQLPSWDELRQAYYNTKSPYRRPGPLLALLYARELAAKAGLDVEDIASPEMILQGLEEKGLASDPDVFNKAWERAVIVYRQDWQWMLGPLRLIDYEEAEQIVYALCI